MECAICAAPASFLCGKCNNGHYCSELHQRVDWPHRHRFVCAGSPSASESDYLTPEETDSPDTDNKQALQQWDIKKTGYLRLPITITNLWLRDLIGKGTYGRVYVACKDQACTQTVVVKIQAIEDDDDEERFEKETAMSRLMEYAQVAPKIFFSEMMRRDELEAIIDTELPDEIDKVGITVLERWDYDLEHVPPEVFQDPDNVERAIDFIQFNLREMHNYLIHADLFAKNVLVNIKKENGHLILDNLVFADFGLSVWNYQKDTISTFEKRFIDYWLRMALVDGVGKGILLYQKAAVDRGEQLKILNTLEMATFKAANERNPTKKSLRESYRRQLKNNPFYVDSYLLKAFKAKYNVK